MRFDITLVDGLSFELTLNDNVGLSESFFNVSQLMLDVSGYVTLYTGVFAAGGAFYPEHGGQIFVEDGGIILEGVVQGQDRGEDFVVNLYEGYRLPGYVGVDRRDRCQSVSLVQHFVMGHYVLGHLPNGALRFGEIDDLVLDDGEVFRGRHGENPRQSLRFAGIYRSDTSMSVGAAQYLSMQHANQLSVRSVFSRSRHLVQAVVADGPGADNPVLLGTCVLPVDCGGHMGILTYRMIAIKQPVIHRVDGSRQR
jgi:hypothetical protein